MPIALTQVALTMIMIGSNVVVGKLLSAALPVAVILFLRTMLASAGLAPFALRRRMTLPRPRIALNLGGQALLGTLAYNSFLLAGLRHTGALQAGLVLSALPAVTAVAAAVALREHLPTRRWLAAGLAAFGMAALAVARSGDAAAGGSWLGNILVFAAVLGETSWIILARAAAGRVGVMQGAFWVQVFSALMLAPWALPQLGAGISLLAAQPRLLMLLLYHALTASLLATVLWYAGLRRVPAGLASVFTVLLPATAAVLAVLVLGERVTTPLLAGFALMLASILLATWPRRISQPG